MSIRDEIQAVRDKLEQEGELGIDIGSISLSDLADTISPEPHYRNNPSYTYTTADELQFVRSLYYSGKYETLRRYRYAIRRRYWSGHGMSVDGERVLSEIARILGRATQEEDDLYTRVHSAMAILYVDRKILQAIRKDSPAQEEEY